MLKVVKSSGFCSTFILQHSVLFATLWWNASIASVPRPDSTLSQASFCLKDWPKRLQTLHFSRKLIFVSLKVELQVYQIPFFFSEQTERVLEFPSVSKLLENCLRVWFFILSHYLDDLKWILINEVGRVVE